MDYFFASALGALLGVSIFGLVSAIADEAARQGCIDGSRVEDCEQRWMPVMEKRG